MNSANLIPAQRRRAKDRARLTARWVAALCLEGGLLAAAIIGCYGFVRADAALGRGGDIAKLDEEFTRAGEALSALDAQTAAARRTLEAVRQVADQPDWSLLLSLVSESADDDLVLDRCELTRVSEPTPELKPGVDGKPPALVHVPPPAPVLKIAGLARTQAAVTRIALKLEATGVFKQVTLVQTSRQQTAGGVAAAFELNCPLRTKAEDPTP